MKLFIIIPLILLLAVGCKKDYTAPVPNYDNWQEFTSAGPLLFSAASRRNMEGIYNLTDGVDVFGPNTAVKWSYVTAGTDTTYHLSLFFGKDIAYIICEGKKLNGDLLLNGYWRKMADTETGIARLTVSAAQVALLTGNNPVIDSGAITINGFIGKDDGIPARKFSCTYNRKLYNKTPFKIIAHRSGGRTSDLLPVSENSVAMILKTSEFGSMGIEVDVRLTRDGTPILYHDNTVNLRETQKSGLIGPIENYTYNQLSTFVRLIHGEKIPTLREALDAVVYQTALSFVWLDTKVTDASLVTVRSIQKEYLQKAAAAGRNVTIVIGIPDDKAKKEFLSLPDYANAPNLCELGLEDVETTKAEIWAPRFTLGTQNDDVAKIHAEGKQVFVWTLDVPEFIEQYIRDGHFDAILSNYPSSVAYYYYVQQ
ncbi:MAG: glycerophosphodiester phosphodiesterase [Bacteroidota bacterium]